MVIPWIGYSLAELIRRVEPMPGAKFVEFVTQADAKTMPGLRAVVADLVDGDESAAVVASAIEFVLEGLHLSKRLNKDAKAGKAIYRSKTV